MEKRLLGVYLNQVYHVILSRRCYILKRLYRKGMGIGFMCGIAWSNNSVKSAAGHTWKSAGGV